MKILGTGLSGLVGSRIVELLKDTFEFDSSSEDIADKEIITKRIVNSDSKIVLHLAAKTDVDGCERDKDLKEKGEAWKVNVLGTENVAKACSKSNKKLVYISTDFVFDGKKSGPYTEDDDPNPINWYGRTKYEGELVVQKSVSKWLILRIAFPYRAKFEKKDFVRKLIDLLGRGEAFSMVIDEIITPTFIDDIAFALHALIKNNATGIYNVVGDQFLSPYDAGLLIAKIFDFDKSLISTIKREEFFKDRAPRPFNLSLKNDKITGLRIRMRTFEEGLEEIKSQI